jgi:aldehyde dehydrogenase (NAD+)
MSIHTKIENLRVFFGTHQTKDVAFRKKQLQKLKEVILSNEKKITEALFLDLHKCYEEAYLTEFSFVLQEIDYHLKNLEDWTKSLRVPTPFHILPSRSKILNEPLGVALIIAPWNYPFQLLFSPLVGAISAGCCTVLKPSPSAPNIAKVMDEMIQSTFDENYICLIQGGREVNELVLKERFDVMFFTGSSTVGKVVMRAAAENLTPVILELGGKSPCIVDEEANLAITAKRIIWGKTINAGQTCIAPDYVFVQEKVKDKLIEQMKVALQELFGEDIEKSPFYARIVHQEAFERLEKLAKEGKIQVGGRMDKEKLFIEPTIIDEITSDSLIMQGEIFGPLLPILTYTRIDDVIHYINANEKPLALYYFGKTKQANEVLRKTSSGGATINDTLMQITNHHLPFGGVGNSGMGSYHGKGTFDAFSHRRGVVTSPTWIDLPLKYPPFKYFSWVKRLI